MECDVLVRPGSLDFLYMLWKSGTMRSLHRRIPFCRIASTFSIRRRWQAWRGRVRQLRALSFVSRLTQITSWCKVQLASYP